MKAISTHIYIFQVFPIFSQEFTLFGFNKHYLWVQTFVVSVVNQCSKEQGFTFSQPTGANNPHVNIEMIVLERGELKTKVSRDSFEHYKAEYKKDSTG